MLEFGVFGGSAIVSILVLVFGIMGLLLPFFVFRIRNETISTNKKLARIIELLEKDVSDDEVLNLGDTLIKEEKLQDVLEENGSDGEAKTVPTEIAW